MQLDREFTIAEIGSLVGVDQNTLRGWLKAGLLPPLRRGSNRGRGQSLVFDLRSILAAGILRSLRRRGATLSYAQPIAEFVANLTPDQIQQAADDDLLLVSAGDAIPTGFRRREEKLVNQSGFPELVFAASVRELWAKVSDGLAFYDRQNIPQHSSN